MTSIRTPFFTRVAPSLPNTLSFNRTQDKLSIIQETNLVFSPERYNAKVRDDLPVKILPLNTLNELKNLEGKEENNKYERDSYWNTVLHRSSGGKSVKEKEKRTTTSLSLSTFSLDSKGLVSHSTWLQPPRFSPYCEGVPLMLNKVRVGTKLARPRVTSSISRSQLELSRPWPTTADLTLSRIRSDITPVSFILESVEVDSSPGELMYQPCQSIVGELVELPIQPRILDPLSPQLSLQPSIISADEMLSTIPRNKIDPEMTGVRKVPAVVRAKNRLLFCCGQSFKLVRILLPI